MKNKSLNNQGFSLIELIIAILIMAIVAGAAIITVSSVSSTETKAAATKISDVMKQARTDTLALENHPDAAGRSSIFVKIYSKESVVYADVCLREESGTITTRFSRKIGKGIKLGFLEGATQKASVGSDEVYIYFKKSTGGIAKIEVKTATENKFEDGINTIKVANASTDSVFTNLIIVNVTGRCYIDE